MVSRNGLAVDDGESGDPSIGALTGLIRVLAYEHPDLRTTLVDLPGDAVAAADRPSCGLTGRRRHRLARRKPLRRKAFPRHAGTAKADTVVRPDGSYIITGGLGGLGLAVARWLVDSGAGRVVLNGRSAAVRRAACRR